MTEEELIDWFVDYLEEVKNKGYNEHIIRQDITDVVKKFADLKSELQSDYWEDYWKDYWKDCCENIDD